MEWRTYKRTGRVYAGRFNEDVVIATDTGPVEAAAGDLNAAAGFYDRSRRSVRRYVEQVLPSFSQEQQITYLRAHDERFLHLALSLGLDGVFVGSPGSKLNEVYVPVGLCHRLVPRFVLDEEADTEAVSGQAAPADQISRSLEKE